MKKLIAFLILASAVFGFSLAVTKDASAYNPTNIVNYTATLSNTSENESVASVQINITITNSTGDAQNTTQVTTNGSGGAANAYTLPSAASAGTWTITATMANNSSVTGTTTFTVNALAASSGSISTNASSYNPGDTVSVTLTNVLTQISTSYNGSATVYLYYDSVQQNSATVTVTDGSGNTSFTLPSNATNTSWKANASFNSTGQSFTVTRLARNPGISASSLSADKGNTTALSVSVTNYANFNDNFTISASVPANITATANTTSVMGSSTSASVVVYLAASGTAGAGSYQVNLTINSTANSSYGNATSVTLTVNPSHSFNISINGTASTGTPGGSAVPFTLNLTNQGEATETYNIACSSNRSWACTPSTASLAIASGANGSVTISASVPQNETQGTISAFTVNVTSSTYGSSYINQTTFTVTAGASVGGSLNFFGTDASNTYWVKASTSRNFTFAINNTGNTVHNYTVNVTASIWNLNVSSTDCGVANTGVSANGTASLACNNVAGLAYKTFSVNIAAPASATPCTNATIALSLMNGSNSAIETRTIIVKAPCFTSTPVLTFNPSTGILIVQIAAVLREGVALAAANISSLTYSILSPAAAVLTTGPANLSTSYTLNYSSTATYPSAVNYTVAVAVTDNSSANYSSGSLRYRFRLVRSVTVAGTSAVSTISGAAFTVAFTAKYDSGDDIGSAPAVTGITCGSYSGTSTYTYSCTAPGTTTTGYASTAAITSCVYDANVSCSLTSALSHSIPITVTISTILLPPQQQGGGGANATNVTQNLTAGASQSVNISMPATANITGAGNLTITISNLANVTQLINASLDELGDYSHFMLNISAPASISAGENATFTVNITPYGYAKPGTYIVTVDVLGQKKNYTVTVPSPAYAPDTVNVNRYIETTRNRSSSVVYLELVNRKFESVNITIREIIPKTLANSTAAVTFLTPYSTVVEDDPVVEWVLTLAPGETAEIRYTVKTDATNAPFSAPEVTETLPPAVAPPAVEVIQQADNTWALVLIGIVVIVGAVFAYLYFVERPLFYRLLQEARFKADGALKWLKK